MRLLSAVWLVVAILSGLGCTELDSGPHDAGTSAMDGGQDDGSVDEEGGFDGGRDSAVDEIDSGRDADARVEETPPSDGGADASDGSVDGDYTVDEFCDDIQVAVCAWQTAKYSDSDASAPCHSADLYIGTVCDGAMQNAIAEGRVSFDPEVARACVALHQLGEDLPRDEAPLLTSYGTKGVCARVVVGTIEDGDPCFPAAVIGGSECDDGVCLFSGGCPSSCSGFREVGESCDQQVEICRDGTYCRSDIGECAEYGELEDTCENDVILCGADLHCKDGMCAPLEAVNGACRNDRDCSSDVCAYADETSTMGLCVVPQDEGGSCQLTGGCKAPLLCVLGECALHDNEGTCLSQANCIGEERCMYIGEDDAYRCEVPIAVGSICTSGGTQCAGDSWCSSEDLATYRCNLPGVEGDSCKGTRYCDHDTHYCDHDPSDARCHARGAQGDSCTRGDNYKCLPDLQCAWDDTCQPFGLAENAPCSTTQEGACADGLFCDRQTHTCVPVRGEDAVCNVIVKEGCEDDLYCACVGDCPWAPAAPDADEQCRRKLVANTLCERDEQCLSGYCNGVCAELPPDGDDELIEALMCNGL